MTVKELYINILNNQQSFWLWNSDQCISRSICSKYKQNTSKERAWCVLSNCHFKEIRNSNNWFIVGSLRIICQHSQDQQCCQPWALNWWILRSIGSVCLKICQNSFFIVQSLGYVYYQSGYQKVTCNQLCFTLYNLAKNNQLLT